MKKGDKVLTKDSRSGEILSMYKGSNNLEVCIVKIDNSEDRLKLYERDLTLIEDPVDPDEITITREEYKATALEAITKIADNKREIAYMLSIFSARLEIALFGARKEND